MLLRVLKSELRLGMFVETVECPAREFSARRFIIDQASTIDKINKTTAVHVLINTKLGRCDIDKSIASDKSARRNQSIDGVEKHISACARDTKGLLLGCLRGEINIEIANRTVNSLASMAERAPDVVLPAFRLKNKDEGTFLHSLSVGTLMSLVAGRSGFSDEKIQEIGVAGLLHDIGKLAIPANLIKKQTKLTDSEIRLFRTHPSKGRSILDRFELPQTVLDVCELHHEYLDGTGYPHRRHGSDIPEEVRICTVCDVYDALTSVRPYKSAWSSKDAIQWMAEREHLFDMKYVLALSHAVLP